MSSRDRSRIAVVGGLSCFAALGLSVLAGGQEQQQSRGKLREPVFRVSKARVDPPQGKKPVNQHALDPALRIARQTLERIHTNVRDYSCTLVKRERIKGKLIDPQYIYTEIRNRKVVNGQLQVPFGVYMRFLKPANIKGREVIYVEGRNNNKLVAHEAGVLGIVPPVWLRPNGPIAMRGQLYPITDVGLENLVLKLIEKGERDKALGGQCEVQFIEGAKINGRGCTVLQVTHPDRAQHFDFHIARIFLDDALQLPVRYAAYSWPTVEGGKPPLLEEYTYLNLKLNLGLKDDDFDHTKKFN